MAKCNNINVEILKWARETAGFSIEDLIPSFKKLASWESRDEFPTYIQLEKLAEKYKRPLAIFFFPEIPNEENIETSFRSLPVAQQNIIPPSVRFMLREGKLFQMNLMELYDAENPFVNELITKRFKGNAGKNLQEFAQKVRNFLGINIKEQKGWKSPDIALKKWRECLNRKGIFIFKNAFKSKEYSGFCLYDKKFPIIYINNSFPETRQIFTLFHELAHLLFEENHIELLYSDFHHGFPSSGNTGEVEVFCNKFASEFLMPRDDFEKEMKQYSSQKNILQKIVSLSNKYKVSREVILRRHLDKGEISYSDYNTYVSSFKMRSGKKKKGGQGNYYNTRMAYLGKPYIDAVFAKYLNRKISSTQAADYLRINEKSLETLEFKYFEY